MNLLDLRYKQSFSSKSSDFQRVLLKRSGRQEEEQIFDLVAVHDQAGEVIGCSLLTQQLTFQRTSEKHEERENRDLLS